MKKAQYTRSYRRLLKAMKQARLEAGLTQKEVGGSFDAHASFVSKCESGERRIDVVELSQFCKLYGLSVAELLARAAIK